LNDSLHQPSSVQGEHRFHKANGKLCGQFSGGFGRHPAARSSNQIKQKSFEHLEGDRLKATKRGIYRETGRDQGKLIRFGELHIERSEFSMIADLDSSDESGALVTEGGDADGGFRIARCARVER
jgi:hypothetical protein